MVRLVDDEYGRKLLCASRDQKLAKLEQQLALILPRRGKTEIGNNVLEEFCRSEPAVEQICVRNVLACPEQAQQAAQQKGLPGANLPCHDNESFVPAHSIVERCQRLVVPPGRDKTRGVGHEVEGVAREMEEGFVHKGRKA